jgi:DNA replication protein DnaC
MSLDGRLLSRAKAKLEEKKRKAAAEHERRLQEVYLKCPRIRELDREIKGSVIDVISLALSRGQDPEAAIEAIRDENLYLQSERVQMLLTAGFPYDYLDDDYLCNKCHDTGYDGPDICSCLMELYTDEQKASLSNLFKLGGETFDSFNLTWYDDTYDPAIGVTPRKNMETIRDTCYIYANKFGKNSANLFLNGPPGLGKTFLSACIARVVSEQGFSVVYDTAASIFSKFEEHKFSKSEDMSEARADIRRYLESDLLIIDDLGTEMTTSYTVSVLYEILNTRLITGKRTVISSNLTTDEMHGRYTPQIMSRIEGEYHVLKFYGSDIRLQKKAL